MTKKDLRKVRTRARSMIRLMNDGGRHWTQGHFKVGRGDSKKFCLLGGAHEVIFGRRMERSPKRFDEVIYTTLLEHLASQIDAQSVKRAEEDRDAPFQKWDYSSKGVGYKTYIPTAAMLKLRQQQYYEALEGIVIEFNDDRGYGGWYDGPKGATTWDDVVKRLNGVIAKITKEVG